ncbi:alpha-glucosidase [Alkalihalophilus marmarensis]|jgi:alpha-glucosidase|uniref:Oligo-1,6-glucosidase n=1 Tax=Alkalihalophilus marmarensis DSM 21297 TaxID=1188261 RepID=U6SJU2_9BACI|nr:alpha-glucosidase [Alkalihalophilus marmarensis]ERN51662.1 oligo-1,6-glucosidase [Alkalihalophilus marmarensis DSM 21297]MCM3491745.1 alpha-glucosidase [Alkalihalophilus marmarensis]
MDRKWWKEAVAYQVYPRSFMDSNGDGIGDLQGVIQKLDYIKGLGIDVIWICPMYRSPNDDNGYDISDYQDIMEDFGNMDDFDQLLKEVHNRDMKLIIDLVINHTSDEHPWFIESRSSVDNPKRDWYIWRDPSANGSEPNNWESIFNGPAWEYDEKTKQYYMHIFSTKQPDLNWENGDVRAALYNMMNWWMDKGIDGFRVDAISHIKKIDGLPDLPNPKGLDYVPSFDGHMNRPGIHKFLQEMKNETVAKYDVMTVGEANGVKLDQADDWVGEDRGAFNMIFQFEHLGLWGKETGGELDLISLKETLTKWQKGLEGRGWNALFLENHDQPRSVSTWGNDKEYWSESAKALGTMFFFMQGTPFVYQGQEIGMTNVQFDTIEEYDDVSMKNFYRIETAKGRSHEEIMKVIWEQGRDNSRTPMQWDDSKNAGFSTAESTWFGVNPNYSDINVAKQEQLEDSILHYYKKMIALRKSTDVLMYGRYDLVFPEHKEVYAYTRTLGDEKYVILVNMFGKEAEVDLRSLGLSEDSSLVLANYTINSSLDSLRPYEARVYRLA